MKRFFPALLALILSFMLVVDAAQISRLKDPEISNDNQINADDLDAEFNAQVAESNSQDNRITTLESGTTSISGAKTYSGSSTFSGAVTMSSTVNVTGGAASKITVAQTTAKASVTNGGLFVSSDASPPGIRYNGTAWQLSNDGTTFNSIDTGAYPTGYHGSALPVYATSNTFTVAYVRERDSTDTYNLVKNTSTTVDVSTTGAGGCDVSCDSQGWIYLYAIGKTDGTTSLLASQTNEKVSGTITLPATYTLKRQIKFAVRNNASSNFIPFYVEGSPNGPIIYYQANISSGTNVAAATNPTVVLQGGGATSATDVDCSTLIPAGIARRIFLHAQVDRATVLALRENGIALALHLLSAGAMAWPMVPVRVDSAGILEYSNDNSSQNQLNVMAFQITEDF